MKRSSNSLLAILLIACTVLVCCGYDKLKIKAEEGGKAFYTNLQKKNYASALAMCSSHAFTKDPKSAWQNAFDKNAGLLGELKSFKQTGKSEVRETSDLGTTVILTYDVLWQYGKSQDSLVFVKEKDGTTKLSHYSWDVKDASFITESDRSEKEAAQYIAAVQANDFMKVTDYCSDSALTITPKIQWVLFLENANQKLGAIKGYKVITDSTRFHIGSTGIAGSGNYYDIVVETERGDEKVKEKMTFYQKNYNNPMKITGHWFL